MCWHSSVMPNFIGKSERPFAGLFALPSANNVRLERFSYLTMPEDLQELKKKFNENFKWFYHPRWDYKELNVAVSWNLRREWLASEYFCCPRLWPLISDRVPREESEFERDEYPDVLDYTANVLWPQGTLQRDQISARIYKQPRHFHDRATVNRKSNFFT